MFQIRYILRRLAMAIFVLLSVSILTFAASRAIPSDPAALFAGPRPSADQVAAARERLRLDRPLYVQYASFLGDALTGDFGISFRSKRPIGEDIARFLPATLELVVASLLIALVIGIPVGAIAAARAGGVFDQVVRVLAISAASLPAFWLALIFQLVFFRWLGWLPLSGRFSRDLAILNPIENVTGFLMVDTVLTGNWTGLGDAVLHLVLPAVTLALYPFGLAVRMTRVEMGEALKERYILAATAMGLSRTTIVFRYALKNALVPTLTVLGLTFAYSITGAVLVEVIYSWPGLGRYVTEAILSVDFPVIMAVTLIGTTFYVLINLVVDLIQAAMDPRIVLK